MVEFVKILEFFYEFEGFCQEFSTAGATVDREGNLCPHGRGMAVVAGPSTLSDVETNMLLHVETNLQSDLRVRKNRNIE